MILKQAEPTTLATDLLLALQAFLFAAILVYLLAKNDDKKRMDSLTQLMWIGGFISIGLFALFGAISHGTFSKPLSDLLWPFTMIFGGICFIFIVAGIIIYQKETDFFLLLLIPLILVVIYFIVGFISGWPFIVWGILLIFCSIIIYFFSFRAKQEGKGLGIYMIIGLTVILISGIVQIIGGIIGFTLDYGINNEFLFQPHNDIFHIIAMIGLAIFFLGFWKQAKGKL
jgi:MFS family permease